MFHNIRKLLLFALVCVNLLPVLAEGETDVVTIVTEDASSVDTLIYGCQRFGRSGTYANILYGDGTRTLDYTIYQRSNSDQHEATINLGETIIFGCSQITPEVPGTVVYYDTVPENGYERIYKLTLHTLANCEAVYDTIAASIFEKDTILFGCKMLWEEGLYNDTLSQTLSSCDSIVTLKLSYLQDYDSVRAYIYDTVYDAVCIGSTYTISGIDFIVNADTTVNDTIADYLPMQVDEVEHQHIYTDSVATYIISVLLPSDTTLQDSIELGQIYTFKGEELTPSEAGVLELLDTVPNMHGCDSVITLELKIIAVEELRDTVPGAEIDTAVCVGTTFTAVSNKPIINQDTIVTDTLWAVRQVKDDILHTLTTIDSVVTYNVVAWLLSDTTLQDSIELGQTYTFKGEELTPSEAGVLEFLDTVPNMHGCDSVISLELKVIAVEELHEYVQGAVQDTLCAGASYTAGSKTLTVDGEIVVTDTVFAVRQSKDEILHTLTYTDSVTTYALLTWNDELNLAEELDWGHAFCGMAYNGAEGVLNALREAIEDDDLFRKDTTLAILYKNESGTYVPYDGIEMSPDRQELSLRAEVSNSCSTLTYDKVLTVEKPDYELSDEFADLPAVSKYNDWLLLVDVDSLNKVYGLYPEADSVRWYKISGAAPDIDNDELVGTGYYYTDDRHLVGYYYAIVTLPIQTDECGGEWRTRIVVRTNGGAPLTIAPNIVRVGTPVYLYHLLTDEVSTLYIYAADGCCVQTLTHQPSADNQDGIATIATHNLSPGVYTVRVTSSSQKAALRFIITQ